MNRDRLLIKSIEIENCGGFPGKHKIEFSTDEEKNFTVIIGYSGRGKSTIFKFIYWCLYGSHYEPRDEHNAGDEGIIYSELLKSLKPTESVTGTVKLIINDQNGELHQLERSITATLHEESSKRKFDEYNNSNINGGIQTEVSSKITFKDKQGHLSLEKDERRINSMITEILPKELSNFFLFDGEKLINFTPDHRDEVSKLIQDGIEKISGLKVLDSLIDHAKKSHIAIQKSISSKAVDSKGLQSILDRLTSEKEDKMEVLQKVKETLDDKQGELESIITRIASSKEGNRIEELLKKEITNKTKVSKNIKNLDKKIHTFLFDHVPEILIRDTLIESEKSFRILEENNLIPPSITREAIDKIFETKKCVCGTPFEENGEIWNALDQIKKTIIDKDMTTGITQGRGLISQIIDRSELDIVNVQYKDLINQADGLSDDEENLTKSISEYNKDIANIGKIGTDDFKELSQIKIDLITKTTDLRGKISLLELQIGDKEDERIKAEQNLNLRLKHEGKYNAELNKINILKAVVKFSEQQRKVVVDKLLGETERVTGEYFKKSAPQSSEFAKLPPKGTGPVKISSKYHISAVDDDGYVKDLSKGQAHVLGLSYVSGCRAITNADTFLFIDSPLHNISGDSRNEIAKILAKFLTNIQIVLFVTDTEYLSSDDEGANSVREYINPNNKVWKEWEIHATCTECKNEKLIRLEKKKGDETVFVCKNCSKEYLKDTKTGPRIIEEFERNVK